ncbi:tetratricopeptide repeat protein [Aquisphaera giovannonii]|uniref:tetratricopeptide repeat protein n=1 Tax=Aquisphaera giovannonii TaxID=406548 RepID=UPI0011DFD714|nr:hypothetical protein [Aquisphaera giovannonii]
MTDDKGSRALVPVTPGRAAASRPAEHTDPYKFWSDFYRTHDQGPEKLREALRILNLSRSFREVHAMLTGYLTQRVSQREPWMYEALALSIEMNNGRPEDVKTALNYAADLAQRTHNPNDLVSAADKLYLKGYYDRVGALLDEAAAKVPHRSEPLVMMINLAQKTRDAGRMGDAVERLLSLGWPGQDEYYRIEARNQVEKLAAALREDAKPSEAKSLLDRLAAAEARDVFIRLSWDGDADYDLVVSEPLGASASKLLPRTVFGGSIVKNGYGKHPEDIYVCPRGFDGEYTVRISMVYSNPEKPTTRLTLETITHEGTPEEKKDSHTLSPSDPQTKPVVVKLQGGRRKTVLPFLSPAAAIESAKAGTAAPKAPASNRGGAAPPRSGGPKAGRPAAGPVPPR